MNLSNGGGVEVQGKNHVIMEEEDPSLEEILFEATLSEVWQRGFHVLFSTSWTK